MALIDNIFVDASNPSKANIRRHFAAQELASIADPSMGESSPGALDGGAVMDGATNNTTAFDAALGNGNTVWCPAGTCVLTAGRSIPTGAKILGAGRNKTVFDFGDEPDDHLLKAEGDSFASPLSDILLDGFGVTQGTKNASATLGGIRLVNVIKSTVSDFDLRGTEDLGVWAVDCDGVVVENGRAEDIAGMTLFDGCSGMKGAHLAVDTTSLHAYRITAPDGESPPANESKSNRDRTDAGGNVLLACSATNFGGVAITCNACDGNLILGMVARTYTGGSTSSAFQNKHVSSDDARRNKFIGFEAYDVHGGCYSQDGEGAIFALGTLEGLAGHGCWSNSAPKIQFKDIDIRGFAGSAVRLQNGAHGSQAIGIVSEATTASGTKGLELINSNNCRADNIFLEDAHGTGVDIDANCANTSLGAGIRIGSSGLADASTATKYPIELRCSISLGSTGTTALGTTDRGLWVGRARVAISVAPSSGTPEVSVGRIGSIQAIAAAQALGSLTAGAMNELTIADRDGGTAAIYTVTVSTASTGGTAEVLLSGLPRL